MAPFKFSSRDIAGVQFLFLLAIIYGLMSALAYYVIHMKFLHPVGIDAPLNIFSEARAVEHVRALTRFDRQEGRSGLREAGQYIKSQLQVIKERSGSGIRTEIEETFVNGSFNMIFLGHSVSLTYRNHSNIIMRISSAVSHDTDASVLVNGHFDSSLGSPGAGDCGSCVASMLEVARLVIDSGWIPPHPIIFLFNGAEELFLLGAHGFMETHKWRHTVGAAINIEASGTGGPDLVCQSGPGAWPSLVYAESAVHPMAHSAAQDVFPLIPGDTDYRIFSEDYGSIPSLDIIFLLGGYYYHTSYDTLEKLLPGSIQARGENLISIVKAFTNSMQLRSHQERSLVSVTDEHANYFDYLSWFMISYTRRVSIFLHSFPIAVFLVMPLFVGYLPFGFRAWFAVFCDFVKGFLFHTAGIILAIILPVCFSILRLVFSSYAMCWYAHPYLAFMMFIPCSVGGLLIPTTVWSSFPLSHSLLLPNKSKQVLLVEVRFWGVFGFYACLTLAYLVAGLSGGFLAFSVSVAMLLAWILYCLSVKYFGCHQLLRSFIFYLLPLIPFLVYWVYFGGFLVQFLIEKMGMIGSSLHPYGFYIADVIIAATVGIVTGWCVGPLLPVCSYWLSNSFILKLLLDVSILALAVSSQFFPYSNTAPKRVVFQHTFVTADANRVISSSFDFAVVDSNSLSFLFQFVPDLKTEINMAPTIAFQDNWLALFPVSFLFSNGLKFPALSHVPKQYMFLPHLTSYKPHSGFDHGARRVHLQLSLGDLEEIWVAVLNVTGPLRSWSFANEELPAPHVAHGSPPSYICRLSGNSNEIWTFWLEASNSDDLLVRLAVIDQVLVDEAKMVKAIFPDWVDVITYSSYMSSYAF